MKIKSLVFVIVFTLILHFSVFAHGIKIETRMDSPFVIVIPSYHGGKVISQATVTVTFEKQDKPFIEGSTDKDGMFRFKPDKPGIWSIRADDGTGHRRTIEIKLDQSFFDSVPVVQPVSATPKTQENPIVNSPEMKKNITAQPDEGVSAKKKPLITKQEWLFYIIKIIIGIALILGITIYLQRLLKNKE